MDYESTINPDYEEFPEYQEFMAAHADLMAALKERDYEAVRRAIERQRVVIQVHKERVERLIYSS